MEFKYPLLNVPQYKKQIAEKHGHPSWQLGVEAGVGGLGGNSTEKVCLLYLKNSYFYVLHSTNALKGMEIAHWIP